MTVELLSALMVFAFVSSVTPGPNNLMLMASGANFGFRRTIPHMLGIGIGFIIMVVLVGVGLIALFDRFAFSHTVLKVFSVIYMSWLAWKIANAAAPQSGKSGGVPLTFVQAAAFQWVNPKAWAMGLTAITAYAPERSVSSIVIVAGVFGVINLPVVSSWTVLGQQMQRVLTNPLRLRIFNTTMAVLLLGSLYPIVFSG